MRMCGVSVGGLANELSYAAALGLAASGRVTLIGEVLGRWMDGPGRIVPVSAAHPTLQGVQTIRLTRTREHEHHLDGARLQMERVGHMGAGRQRHRPGDGRPHREVHAVYRARVCVGTLTSARMDWIFQSGPFLRSLKDQMRGSMRGS